MRRVTLWALLAALTACARPQETAPVIQAPLLENQNVRAVMSAALLADAAGKDVDTLYLVGVAIVADGLPVRIPPRFAGVQRGGSATVTAATLEITPYLAWGIMEYRWTPGAGGATAYGRATFVLERAGGSWRIKHLHSSSLREGRT